MASLTRKHGHNRGESVSANIIKAVVSAVSLLAGTSAQAQAPLEAYGALPALEHVQISPSGDQLVYMVVVGDERAMLITDLATGTTTRGYPRRHGQGARTTMGGREPRSGHDFDDGCHSSHGCLEERVLHGPDLFD